MKAAPRPVPFWRQMPESRTLRLVDGPNATQVYGFTVAVRPEGDGWHWGVVGILRDVIGKGDVPTLVEAMDAAEAVLPLRFRRRLAVNAGSDRSH